MIKSLKTPKLLTTIPAHQPQHHHHLSPSIVTFLTSSTLKISNETFKTDYGNVSKLTEENYPVWNEKICQVLITTKSYNIVTSVEVIPVGNCVTLCPLHANWHNRANMVIGLIHLGCCDELLPIIDDINNPVGM